ncbi:MAG: CBS domain-containing protein [Janthinobacterium lividum]
MLQLAIPFGRWFGVHLRIHLSFFLLLALGAGYSAVATGGVLRGVGLWLALCAAVAVRETARAIAAAYAGTPLRALFLMPFGGVMALEPRPGGLSKRSQRAIALSGSLANLGTALFLIGFSLGVDPHVALLQQPWITIEHILRSAVWLQVAMGLVNLLPAKRLNLQNILRSRTKEAPAEAGAEISEPKPSSRLPAFGRRVPAFGLGTALALALIVSGFFLMMFWPVLLGITLLFMNYVTRLAAMGSGDASNLTVGDVMLTEYLPLSAAVTLRDALRRTTHTLQDTFPVVRGERLVGWISRTALAARLQTEGDSYLQGSMQRSLQVASPGEKLGEALRRAAALGAHEFIPVIENGAMVGMLTPSGLERAVGQIRLTQPPVERSEA